MSRRIFSVILALCLLAGLSPPQAWAATIQSGECGDNLTWTLDDDGTLTISGTGPMTDYPVGSSAPWLSFDFTSVVMESGVTTIGAYAFSSSTGLTGVTIPDTVTSIGENAFSDCYQLESVTIPASVASIGPMAFYMCNEMTSATISNGVTSIGESAFMYCSRLESVTIPASVTSIDAAAFSGCDRLTEINVASGNAQYVSEDGVLFNQNKSALLCYPAGKSGTTYSVPEGVASIGRSAFEACNALTSVTVPTSVTTIGEEAFRSCEGLTSVTISEGLTSIENSAFHDCIALTEITIPASVTTISGSAFFRCEALADVYYGGTETQWATLTSAMESNNDPLLNATIHYNGNAATDALSGACGDNLTWTLANGVLTISGTGPMWDYSETSPAPWYDSSENITAVVIENGVTSIGNSAFFRCGNGGSLTIPNSVITIGEFAFAQCGFTALTIPDSVTTLGASAFISSRIESIVLSKGITTLQAATFQYCDYLKSITIPDSVTSIEISAFYASGLIEVTIPDSVTSIGGSAFGVCNALTDVYYGGTEAQWATLQSNIGSDNDPLLNATIHFAGSDAVTECHVFFEANGGSGEMEPVTVTPDSYGALEYVLPQCAFTPPENSRFYAWQCTMYDAESNTTVREGNVGDGLDLQGVVSLGLTALWESDSSSITITFDASGGSGTMDPVTVEPGAAYTFPQCLFTPPDGAVFGYWLYNECGWYPQSSVTFEADATIETRWIRYEDTYVNRVIWYADDETTVLDETTYPDGETEPVTNVTPTRADDEQYTYVFAGWQEMNVGGGGSSVPYGYGGFSDANGGGVVTEQRTLTRTVKSYRPVFNAVPKQDLDPYRVLESLHDMDTFEEQTWHLAGPLSEFRTLTIDDTVLTQGADYTAEDGSTKLNIPAGTFENVGEGTHSVAAEFQTSPDPNVYEDDGRRAAAEYYTVKPSGKVTIDASEINAAKAVKDVSYTSRFYTSPRLNDDYYRFVVTDGEIPAGLTFHDGGYFTGVIADNAAASYTFTVGLQIRKNADDPWPDDDSDTVQVTIAVEEDTTANVETSSDPGYELVERISATMEESGGMVHLASKGPFEEFQDFYIDGVRQIRGVDYQVTSCLIDADTGEMIRLLDSGAITGTYLSLNASKLSIGAHSLNLEFVKTDPIGNKQTRNASQKVTVTQRTTPAVTPVSGGGGGSSAPSTYSVTASKASNGKITLSATKVAAGKTVTITLTPNSGYQIGGVSVTDSKKNSVSVTRNGSQYTFTMPKRAVTVSATFTQSSYGVSANSAQHGKITLDKSAATSGATVNGSTTPDKGYLLSGVTVRDADGKSVKVETFDNGKFTFLMPSGKATVSATFTVKRLGSFVDIQGPDWFFDDAEWAYNRGIIQGTTPQYWEPQSLMSSITSIVTLERLDGVDLTPYDTGADDGLDNSAWYVAALRWANANNITLADRPFGGQNALTRGEFAVMLSNYLRYRGLNVAAPDDLTFTDAASMTPDELNAFLILQEADVFRGYSDGSIRPNAYLSRAHLSALLHRLSAYIIQAESGNA